MGSTYFMETMFVNKKSNKFSVVKLFWKSYRKNLLFREVKKYQ